MSSKTPIFFTGATGYVGGTVIDRLLKHPTFETSEFTVLVRKADAVPAFKSLGIKTVLGSYDDHELLEKQASLSDIVFSIADSDNALANDAILRGLKKRYEATGKPPLLIHTTGSGIIMDSAQGEATTEATWDDTDVARLETIPDVQLHRNVDAPILAADKEGYVKAYLVCPVTIFGVPSGKLVDLGVQKTRSIQIPMAIASSIARKRAGHVGQGLNVWPAVEVNETADFYIYLYDAILAGKASHGREGTYFVENGLYLFKDLSAKIGEALYDLGVSETAEASSFNEGDFKNFPYLGLLGTNCKCVATRARALGWKPKYTVDDMLKGIRGEVEEHLKNAPRA
ncbi:hypothetical protein V8E55_012090 [Tylopilus felleus]